MTFIVTIRTDAKAAQGDAEKLVTTLEQGEAAGARMGEGITRGAAKGRDAMGRFVAGARQGSSATDAVRDAAAGLDGELERMSGGLRKVSGAFSGLTTALQREHDILERINAPLRRYTDDLQVLDSLLERSKIDTHQYAEEVRKLNQQLEKTSTIK